MISTRMPGYLPHSSTAFQRTAQLFPPPRAPPKITYFCFAWKKKRWRGLGRGIRKRREGFRVQSTEFSVQIEVPSI